MTHFPVNSTFMVFLPRGHKIYYLVEMTYSTRCLLEISFLDSCKSGVVYLYTEVITGMIEHKFKGFQVDAINTSCQIYSGYIVLITSEQDESQSHINLF